METHIYIYATIIYAENNYNLFMCVKSENNKKKQIKYQQLNQRVLYFDLYKLRWRKSCFQIF